MATPPSPDKGIDTEGGVDHPFQVATFRNIWATSLFSNLGQQLQAVASAWTMLQLTHEASWAALVQTASMLPIMFLAVPAGAVADMHDRRRVAIAALLFAMVGATVLAALAIAGQLNPQLILLGCFVVGTGIALYSPAWHASTAELVGPTALPAAVALFSMSSNIARSIGPAIGGLVVATLGGAVAFTTNAVLYLPIIVALWMWRNKAERSRLPPERLDRAVLSGLRFVRHSPDLRLILTRTFALSVGGAAVYGLLPAIARDTLAGGAATYGILLGAFGVGAVTAAVNVERIRNWQSADAALAACIAAIGAGLAVAALSHSTVLTSLAMFVAGGGWLLSIAQLNVMVQMSSPRWVSGRVLATFQTSCAGGLAIGALLWGQLASRQGLEMALFTAIGSLIATLILGWLQRLPVHDPLATSRVAPRNQVVSALDVTGRSGPIMIEIEYVVPLEKAREFYHLIRRIQQGRERDGAFNATIARDIERPEQWYERFQYPTWNDYLRSRERMTEASIILRDQLNELIGDDRGPTIRRLLERPFGSVRWRDETRDPGSPAQPAEMI